VARLRAAYVLTYPEGGQGADIVPAALRYLAERADALQQLGQRDIVVDPGFGFGKTAEENFRLLSGLGAFRQLGLPVLVGVSRKRMVYEPLQVTPEEALNGTTVVHTAALLSGAANILRVHDVLAARQAVRLTHLITPSTPSLAMLDFLGFGVKTPSTSCSSPSCSTTCTS